METANEYVVRTQDDLSALGPYGRRRLRGRFRKIRLDPDVFRGKEIAPIDQRLNDLYFACGCGEAMAAGIVGLVVALARTGLRQGGFGSAQWTDVAIIAGTFFLFTGAGKAIGLLRAQAGLTALLCELRTQLPGGHETVGAPPLCGVR